jgi:hypothetical protein
VKSVVKTLRLSFGSLSLAILFSLAGTACKSPTPKLGVQSSKFKVQGSTVSDRPTSAPPLEASAPPASTTATYDKAMIKSIQVRWMQLLDQRGYGGGVKGRMVVQFNLRSDGSVSDITIIENNLPASFAVLCESAIKDVSPFSRWPDPMRREVGKDQRTVRFNFSF